MGSRFQATIATVAAVAAAGVVAGAAYKTGLADTAGVYTGNSAAASTGAHPTAGTPGYSRDEFGNGWKRTGPNCDTRDDILKRDLQTVQITGACDVTGGTGVSFYTGEPITEQTSDIDHLYAEKAAWDGGADKWTRDERIAFANNPAELIAVDAHSNRSKGDGLPSVYLPPRNGCEYGRRVVAVAQNPVPGHPELHLPLAQADLDAVNRACK